MMEFIEKWWMIVVGGLIFGAVVIGTFFVVTEGMPEIVEITAVGHSTVSFDVYYFENELFPENPVPPGFQFMRHMTDFIRIQSGFLAEFSEEFDLHYSYSARTRFVITYGIGGSAVYERITELSFEYGRQITGRLVFSAENVEGTPGGTYVIVPHVYYEIFNDFVRYAEQDEGYGPAANLRGLTSELIIEFTYSLTALPINISESVTTGFRIPITLNVFTLEPFGSSSFSTQVNRSLDAEPPGVLTMVLLAVGLLISVGLVVYGVRGLFPEKSDFQKSVDGIIKKYGTEIVVSRKPLNLDNYQIVQLEDFEDMIKLSINLAKHITCYKSAYLAVFYIVIDGFVYCHRIKVDLSVQEIQERIAPKLSEHFKQEV